MKYTYNATPAHHPMQNRKARRAVRRGETGRSAGSNGTLGNCLTHKALAHTVRMGKYLCKDGGASAPCPSGRFAKAALPGRAFQRAGASLRLSSMVRSCASITSVRSMAKPRRRASSMGRV